MGLKKMLERFYYELSLNELKLMNESRSLPNLTYNSLLYLDIIDYTENCTVSLLAERLSISKPAVTMKVNELIKQGWLEKTQSENDRRVFYLTLRPQVGEMYEDYRKILNYAVEKMKKEFSGNEIEKFCEMLNAFNNYYLEGFDNE